jgi:hypothetical protein
LFVIATIIEAITLPAIATQRHAHVVKGKAIVRQHVGRSKLHTTCLIVLSRIRTRIILLYNNKLISTRRKGPSQALHTTMPRTFATVAS